MVNSPKKTQLRCYKCVLETVVANLTVPQVFQAFVDFNWGYKYLWVKLASTTEEAWCVTKFKNLYEQHGVLPEQIGSLSFKGGPPVARRFYRGCLKDFLLDLLFTSICDEGPRKVCLFLSKYNEPNLRASTAEKSNLQICFESGVQIL